jgi:hypothetical protein
MNDYSSTPSPKILPPRCRLPVGRPDRCDCVALMLQGGGALGAHQAGVYQAMHEANILPDWGRLDRRDQRPPSLPETRRTGAWRSFTPFGI